ncbi:MAG: Rrf2 family transcriptional regulator [Clostridia bacterium]|nr:Rrf2 family transcriptional regulator [Clostridia bacterium]
MHISSKGRYAVRILTDLATSKSEYTSITEMAERQNISVKYLEKIMNILVKGKLVESLKGSNGGYKLTRQPKDYSVYDILLLTGDTPTLAPCQNSSQKCVMKDKCTSIGYWDTLQKMIIDNLKKITIQNIIDKTY